MAVRICPHCKTEIAASSIAAYSFGVECPKCETRLEVAPGPRAISSLCGLAAGAIVWRMTINPGDSGGDLASVLPTLYAFLAFGIVSPLVLMFSANLRNAPIIPVPEPGQDHGGHAVGPHIAAGDDVGGHSGGHH